MTIKSVRLTNFRGFRNCQLELKPLTVLLGPNSSGKSSFGHALAAMAHAHRLYAGGPGASLTPPAARVHEWPVDLGNTTDLRTTGATGDVRIALETAVDWVEYGFGGIDESLKLDLSFVSLPTGERTGAGPTAHVPVSPETLTTTSTPSISVTAAAALPQGRVDLKRINAQQWAEGSNATLVAVDGLIVNSARHEEGTSRPLSLDALKELRHFFEALCYLQPSRKRPLRHYEDAPSAQQSLGYAGEYVASLLFHRGAEVISHRMPPPLPQVKDISSSLRTWSELKEPLSVAASHWLDHLKLAERVDSVRAEGSLSPLSLRVTLKEQPTRDVTELGFGVSQVLPVLIGGLIQPPDSLFVVDLPEAHLHPRPQGMLADFFCALALSGRTSLVETHSEMFFHHLRLRAALHPELLDKIAIYFIDEPKDGICCTPRLVGLAANDEPKWPEGFLHEGWVTQTLILAARMLTQK